MQKVLLHTLARINIANARLGLWVFLIFPSWIYQCFNFLYSCFPFDFYIMLYRWKVLHIWEIDLMLLFQCISTNAYNLVRVNTMGKKVKFTLYRTWISTLDDENMKKRTYSMFFFWSDMMRDMYIFSCSDRIILSIKFS